MQALECRTQRKAAGVEADSCGDVRSSRGVCGNLRELGGASLLEAPTYGEAMLLSHSTLEGKGGEKEINLPPKKQLPAPTVLPPRKNISQSKERKIPRVFLAYPWAPATGIGAVPRVYILLLVWTPEDFPASQGLRDICLSAPRGHRKATYLPAFLAVFLQRFLRHCVHKLRVIPRDFFWQHHRDGVRVKELHHHLSDTGGDV